VGQGKKRKLEEVDLCDKRIACNRVTIAHSGIEIAIYVDDLISIGNRDIAH